jgi:hypothetical protein
MSQLAHTQPRRATEIIDASFRFYRAHFGNLLVISALLLVPMALIGALVPDEWQRPVQFVGNWMYLICEGAIAVLVAAAIERDESLSAGAVFRALGGNASKVISASIMSGLMVLIGFILLIVPGFIVLSWTMVAVPVAAIEGFSNRSAISRSRELARGRMGHVLGTMLLAWVIVVALMLGLALVLGMLFALVGLPDRLTDMLSELVMVPLFPLVGVAVTLLYYDLRVRSEGADLEAMMEGLPETP